MRHMQGTDSTDEVKLDPRHFREKIELLLSDLEGTVAGSGRVVRFILIALLSGNHILLEGVPGLAKTKLANEFSRRMGLSFRRIQFTPDLLPSDVMGAHILNSETRKLEFRPGPVFTNVLLADEINRTPPKVQSALLEAMEERHVTSSGEIFSLPFPFIVIATQNPIEYEGTFPLAEALLDRFLFRYRMEYPTKEDELRALDISTSSERAVQRFSSEEIVAAMKMTGDVRVEEDVKAYIVNLIRKTRETEEIYLGASPRTSVKLLSAARACALINGRMYVIPDDIRYVAHELFNHRLILKQEFQFQDGYDPGKMIAAIVDRIIADVPPPGV